MADGAAKPALEIQMRGELACLGEALDLHHFKVFFAGCAFWARPVHGHLVPRGTWGNTVFGISRGFVINPTTNETHPSFCHGTAFFNA